MGRRGAHPYCRPNGEPQPEHREVAIMHVQRRAWERLGIAMSKPEVEELSREIERGKFGEAKRRDRRGRDHYAVTIGGHAVRVIYCPRLGTAVTLFKRPFGTKRGDNECPRTH